MAFQAPAIQNMASVATDLWPSISSALQTPWRSAPKGPTRITSTTSRRAVNITNRIDGATAQKRAFSTSIAQSRSRDILPECIANAPAASLRTQISPEVLRTAPTAVGIFGSMSKNALLQCSPLPRKLPLFGTRQFSTSTKLGPFTLRPNPPTMRLDSIQKRTAYAANSSFNHLAHMEQTANNNPGSASSQNAFYSALLRAGRPDLVVQRYETNRFASNPACETLYNRALERLQQGQDSQVTNGATSQMQNNTNLSNDQLNAVAQALGAKVKGNNAATAKSGNGAKTDPLYVVVEESIGARIFSIVKFALWFIFSAWSVYILTTLLFEAGGMLKRVGGQNNMEAKPEVQKTRFSDVHGCEEAKDELQELVEFLKDPAKFSTLGGKLPKGVLLTGPPGTGKTLLARAVAGEAGVPFFYMSGSEFDEVYVGVGAKRVRELFNAARTKAPAIVFIDELDAIGGKRNERDHAYAKQTLNQLLTELDGFDPSVGVIFIAATNFPESLDKALLRPGRFDRKVAVPLPDVRGRMAILKHHMRKMQLGSDVDESVLARGTPGFSGAELENLVNQAAVYASKRKATKIHMLDLEWAKDKILMGAERKSAVYQERDFRNTAWHEGGHALVALYNKDAIPLYKATIMPRGHALGITFQLEEMDRSNYTKAQYLAMIDVAMGGKIGEEILEGSDKVSGGAASDIQSATSIALQMVTRYGMSDKLGNVDLASNYNSLPTETKQLIWEEVRRLVEEGRARAQKVLQEKRVELERLANALFEYETLNKEEIEKVVKGEKLEGKMKRIPNMPVMLELGKPKGTAGQGNVGPQNPLPPSEEPSGTPGGGGGLGAPLPVPSPPPAAGKAA